MRIQYRFANGDVSNVEVDEALAEALRELNQSERNDNRKETRRHDSMDMLVDELGMQFASEADVWAEVDSLLQSEQLKYAIKSLKPEHQELVHKVFWQKESIRAVACGQGVDESTVREQLKRVYTNLCKFLN